MKRKKQMQKLKFHKTNFSFPHSTQIQISCASNVVGGCKMAELKKKETLELIN